MVGLGVVVGVVVVCTGRVFFVDALPGTNRGLLVPWLFPPVFLRIAKVLGVFLLRKNRALAYGGANPHPLRGVDAGERCTNPSMSIGHSGALHILSLSHSGAGHGLHPTPGALQSSHSTIAPSRGRAPPQPQLGAIAPGFVGAAHRLRGAGRGAAHHVNRSFRGTAHLVSQSLRDWCTLRPDAPTPRSGWGLSPSLARLTIPNAMRGHALR